MSPQKRPHRVAGYWKQSTRGWELDIHEIASDSKARELEIARFLLPKLDLTESALDPNQNYEKPDVILESGSSLIGVELTEAIDCYNAALSAHTDRLLGKLKSLDVGVKCYVQLNIHKPISDIDLLAEEIQQEYKSSLKQFNDPDEPPCRTSRLTMDAFAFVALKNTTGLKVIPSMEISTNKNLVLEAVQKKCNWEPEHKCDQYLLLVHEHESVTGLDYSDEEFSRKIQALFEKTGKFPFDEVWYVFPISSPPLGNVKRLWKKAS